MSALLHIVTLRRHAAPNEFLSNFGSFMGTVAAPAMPPYRGNLFPRLVAAWHVGPDQRLTCSWTSGQAEVSGRPST